MPPSLRPETPTAIAAFNKHGVLRALRYQLASLLLPGRDVSLAGLFLDGMTIENHTE